MRRSTPYLSASTFTVPIVKSGSVRGSFAGRNRVVSTPNGVISIGGPPGTRRRTWSAIATLVEPMRCARRRFQRISRPATHEPEGKSYTSLPRTDRNVGR